MKTHLTLTRQPANGLAVRGTLTLSTESHLLPALSREGGERVWSTLENAAYIIPCGTYTVCITYSPRFRRLLPLVCNVKGIPGDPSKHRSGIRFHRGTRPEHSEGCILLPNEQSLECLIQTILRHEEAILTIADATATE